MKSCKNNANFFWCNLKKKLRLDGRNFEDSRNISIYFLGEHGNVEVSIGHTKVICRITSEIVKPFDKKPNEGIVKVNLDIDSFTNANDNSQISDECLEIRNLIERILKSSNLLNFESLCIIPQKKVWCLLVNIIVIENDGNLYDSCYLSAYSGLVHYRNNEVTVDNSGNIIIEEGETSYTPLSIHNTPILTTFAYFNCEAICLIDPSIQEEEFMSSKLSVALNKNGKLVSILKPGGSPISYEKILEAIELAKKRVKSILKILEDALEEDKHLRNSLKKKNLQIKYSSNPVHIKYDDARVHAKPLVIPTNKSVKNNLNIEKIIKKYEQYIYSQEVKKEGKEKSAQGETTLGDTTRTSQYLLNEELRKLKQKRGMKNGEEFAYMDKYDDDISEISDISSNFGTGNEVDLRNADVGKIKRQEFSDGNSHLHNLKMQRTSEVSRKEITNPPECQPMGVTRTANDRIDATVRSNPYFKGYPSFQDQKRNASAKKHADSSVVSNDDSSDIDFSVAINQNLKKTKRKKS
ncbi:exosome complex component RRP45 [Plasmodium inui San Antonio 1]|uniref:Exosome complex component RRP45 n=1 Tax=Plasmodium inui San Antonio 1 TaxID=1237626 RepID=W7ABQ4_9APIC|nr:exosome complex component RRP45 [Plasmodium inui San Antonio 1]EUD68733.1 exosome complex component RRP45 [Plasmodium inui San Antonio 1]